jgi:CheY-like chemotaxis protein
MREGSEFHGRALINIRIFGTFHYVFRKFHPKHSEKASPNPIPLVKVGACLWWVLPRGSFGEHVMLMGEKSGKPRILIIDDSELNRRIGQVMLESAGFEVLLAGNGAEGEKIFLAGGVSLILMDIQMPVMDGFEVTRLIRAHEEKTEQCIPILAFTANMQIDDFAKCQDAGMTGLITKPIKRDSLITTVKEFIEASEVTPRAAP